MREVRDLASTMRNTISAMKKAVTDAQAELATETDRAMTNAEKVRSVAGELREANKEVENYLGETGSNFPPSEGLNTQPPATDRNGVTVNQESGS